MASHHPPHPQWWNILDIGTSITLHGGANKSTFQILLYYHHLHVPRSAASLLFLAHSSCLLVNQGQSIACSNNYQEDLVALAIVEKVRLVYSLQRDKNSTSKLLGKNLQGGWYHDDGSSNLLMHKVRYIVRFQTTVLAAQVPYAYRNTIKWWM